MATVTVRNGVNVDQLVGTIEAIKADPELAQMTFRAGITWQEGTRSKAEIGTFKHKGAEDPSRRPGQFQLTGDEPPVLLGANAGPNAVELCLSALGFCYAVGYVANAAAQGIEIQELTYDVEGDIDLHAFLGLGKGRPGFTAIRVRGRVKSPNATPEQLETLCQYVQDTSPVKDILANPVPVETDLEVVS
jgi:uncharacterized OsmC-like protein